jgi:large subunit ribosomal protein L2
MGKPLRQQRAGKGSPAFRRPSHRFKADVMFRNYDAAEREGVVHGEVVGLVDDPARTALLMDIKFEDNQRLMLIAPEGMHVGSKLEMGTKASISLGNVLPLALIPDGTPIYNIEASMGDGGKFVRSGGSSAFVVGHKDNYVLVRLPSKQVKYVDPRCRAQIGIVSGGGAPDLPMMKAGKMHHKAHARNLSWPHVRGVAMNPVDHPYGGKQNHPGKPTTTGRGTPPGRKVGHIAARTVGRLTAAKQALKMLKNKR